MPFASKASGFIGRKDKLSEIHISLKSGKATHIGQARNIQGMGGLGKTQLAVEYAHHFRSEYPNGVYWLTADADINNQLITIGEAERWIFRDDKSVNQFNVAKERFLKVKDCLIIFDNVETVADIKSFIPIEKKSVHVLITSRDEQSGFDKIDLDILSPDDSAELLISIAQREMPSGAEKEAFAQLIEELDGLPLALELVGGYLAKRNNISFQNYLKHFNTESLEKIEARFPDESFTNHDISIIRTLTISEELLNTTPYLQDILDVLAWSGSSTMSVSLLQAMVNTANDFDFEEALAIALELKLLKKDDEAERYAIHRLLGRVRRLEKPLEKHHDWHQKALNGLIKWFKERKEDFNHLIEYEDMLEHLEKWELQSSDLFPIEIVNLIWLKAYPFWHRGNYEISNFHLEKALTLYERENIEDKVLLANIKCDFGSIKISLRKIEEGKRFGAEALQLREKLFKGNHKDIALSLNNVGISYYELQNYTKALEYFMKALKMQEDVFNNQSIDIARSLNNIGNCYLAKNQYKISNEISIKSLEMLKRMSIDKHPLLINVLGSVGNSYHLLGDYRKAMFYTHLGFEMSKDLLGLSNFETGRAGNNLINTLIKLGQRKKAKNIALEIVDEIPINHPDRQFIKKVSKFK